VSELLVKIRVLLSGDEDFAGESLWAKSLGGSLYEVRNAPFLANDLNWGDIVYCEERRGRRPVVRHLVERGGHRTLRVVLLDDADETRNEVFAQLTARGAVSEHAWGRLHAVDIRPEVDYEAVCAYLTKLEEEGVLQFGAGGGAAADDSPSASSGEPQPPAPGASSDSPPTSG
jgi:hypothetical protein